MEILNYEVLEKSGYDGYILKDAPEKVMQFGEGSLTYRTKRLTGTANVSWYSPSSSVWLI